MYDLVIRGGTIVDGTGAPGYRADVAIADGRIAAIGSIAEAGAEEIDATGKVICPGFIDVHTHYDGQFLWDDMLEPSFSNGVTTVIGGNCGVGFAPVHEEHRHRLVELMEGVEDIPGIVLDEGLDWQWKSFPDYLDRLDARHYAMDIAAHVPHAPLRVFVMGERALRHEQATDEDLAAMAELVRESMDAGAIGVSGSRVLEHLSSRGDAVPGTFADDRELLTLARAMGESGHGTFQIVPLGAAGGLLGNKLSHEGRLEEHARFARIAAAAGRPLTYTLHAHHDAPEEWRDMMAASQAARDQGIELVPQIASRGLGLLLSLDAFHIFLCRPSYMEIAHLPRAERAAEMRRPERRAAILGQGNVPPEQAPSLRIHRQVGRFTARLGHYHVMSQPFDYEPDGSSRLDVIAAARGTDVETVFYDLLSEGDGGGMVVDFAMNYPDNNLDTVGEMLAHPLSMMGLGDGGAHLLSICDGAMPTYSLSFWARGRTRGPCLPIEMLVHKLTLMPAEVYGMHDRGAIEVGRRADINVVDLEVLGNYLPEVTFDLPSGAGRIIQRAHGYVATMVAGTITRRDDRDTGKRPGRLVRQVA